MPVGRRAAILCLAVAGLLATPLATAADAVTAGPSRCDDPGFACALEAMPAFAPDGALWLAWSSAGRVRVARSPDRGRTFGPPVEVTGEAVRLDHSADSRPQLVVDRAGRVTVGFAVMTDVPFKGEIFHAHSADGGRTFTPARPLDASSTAGKRFLSLSLDPGGAVFAAWIDKRDLEAAQAAGRAYAGAAVYAAWSADGGASFGPPIAVQSHTCECCRIAVAHAGPAQPALLWRNLFGKARDHAVVTLRPTGEVGPVHRLSRDDWEIEACPHHGPGLAVMADGSYHAAWFTASDTRKGLFVARSTDSGARFTTPVAFGDARRQPARPQLLAAGRDLWLAWREFDGRTTAVVAMQSTDGGQQWGERSIVARTAGAADHPVLVSDGAGSFVSWLTRAEGYRLLPLPASAGITRPATSRSESSGSP